MEKQFRALLTSSTAITAVCPSDRISWGVIAQGRGLPAIVLNTISDIEGIHMNGPSRFYEGLVQVDVYAGDYGAAKDLANAVRTLLHGFRNTNFRLILHANSRDSRETDVDRAFRVSLDFNTAWRA